MNPLMIAGGSLLAGLLIWRFLPVGTLYGRRIRLYEWPTWRANLRHERILAKLKAARSLTGENKIKALAKLTLKFGDEPFGLGDDILEALVSTGADSTLDFLLGMLRVAPELAAKPVLRGITAAAKEGLGSQKWRSTLLAELIQHIESPHYHWRNIESALLALDQEKAVEALTSGPGFTATSQFLESRLQAMRLADVRIARESLEPLRDALICAEPNSAGKPIEFLMHWAVYDRHDSVSRLRQFAAGTDPAAMAAAEALLELENLPHPRFGIADHVERTGPDVVAPEIRTVWIIDAHYCYPISIGMPGDIGGPESIAYSQELPAALEVIGASRHAECVRALLVEPGLAESPRTPHQDDATAPHNDEAGSEWFDEVYTKTPDLEDLPLLLLRYIIDHPDAFRSICQSR